MFSPEQVMAMMLTKLKMISETELSTKVTDCVVSVSTYFKDLLAVNRILKKITAWAASYFAQRVRKG